MNLIPFGRQRDILLIQLCRNIIIKMDTPPAIVKKSLANSLIKNSLTPCRRVGLGRPSSGSLNKSVQVRTINTPQSGSAHFGNQNSLSAISQNKKQATSSGTLPLKEIDGQNKEVTKVRRCLTEDLNTKKLQCLKRTAHENSMDNDIMLNEVKMKCDSFVKGLNHTGNSVVKKCKSELSTPISSEAVAEEYENKNVILCKTDLMTDVNTFEKGQEVPEEIIAQLLLSLLEKKKKLDQLEVQETYAKKHNLEELRAQSAKWRAAGQEALRHCARLATQAGYSVSILQLMEQHGFPPDLMGYNADDDEFE